MYSVRKYAKEMMGKINNGHNRVDGGVGYDGKPSFSIIRYAVDGNLGLYHYGTKIAEINLVTETVNVEFGGYSSTDQRFINDIIYLLGWRNAMMCKRHKDNLSIITI